jgi:hypothetical protein
VLEEAPVLDEPPPVLDEGAVFDGAPPHAATSSTMPTVTAVVIFMPDLRVRGCAS